MCVAVVMWVLRTGGRPVRLPAWTPAALVGSVLALLAASPLLYTYTVGLVQQKATTTSAQSRSAADEFAVGVFFRTFGIGAGLGSNRPSSLAMLLLSNVGLVGTVLFVATVVVAMVGGYRQAVSRPYFWALVGVLGAGLSSKPDLSEPMLWFLVALSVRAAADAEVGRVVARRPGVPTLPGGRRYASSVRSLR